MYISRQIESRFLALLEHFPSVAILGPRQVGKTTLVKRLREQLRKESIYLDLENPQDAQALENPMDFFDTTANKTVIIDEIQRKPDLFQVLRSAIDKKRDNARFILLGSASPQLLFLSNETLAGRISYMELSPLFLEEIKKIKNYKTHILQGGFPDPFLLKDEMLIQAWFKSFISAYIERDLRLLGLNSSPLILERLFYMISTAHGSLLNISNLSRSLGVSFTLVNNALSYFERSFNIRLLQPWHANIGKRLIKSPKIYIRDSGIANYLLHIQSYEDLLKHHLAGQIWEGYVIENIINSLGDNYNYYFYRTADGTECDLLIFKGLSCIAAIDAKFSAAPSKTKSMALTIQDIKPLQAFFVIPECPNSYALSTNIKVVSLDQLFRHLNL